MDKRDKSDDDMRAASVLMMYASVVDNMCVSVKFWDRLGAFHDLIGFSSKHPASVELFLSGANALVRSDCRGSCNSKTILFAWGRGIDMSRAHTVAHANSKKRMECSCHCGNMKDFLGAESSTRPDVDFFRCCDHDRLCQYVLRTHEDCSKSTHRLSSLQDRVSPQMLEQLQSIFAKHREDWEEAASKPCKVTGLSSWDKKATWLSSGRNLVVSLWKALEAESGACCKTAPCIKCGTQCPIHPVKAEDQTYLHIAGSSCIAWSSMGKRDGWFSSSAIEFIIWLHDICRVGQADIIIHENVPSFDVEVLPQLVPEYEIQSLVLNPLMFGLPSSRERRYSVLCKTASHSAKSSWSGAGGLLRNMLLKSRKASGKVYFAAPMSLVRKALQMQEGDHDVRAASLAMLCAVVPLWHNLCHAAECEKEVRKASTESMRQAAVDRLCQRSEEIREQAICLLQFEAEPNALPCWAIDACIDNSLDTNLRHDLDPVVFVM
eukprot:2091038-Amphidinium_carterae.3